MALSKKVKITLWTILALFMLGAIIGTVAFYQTF